MKEANERVLLVNGEESKARGHLFIAKKKVEIVASVN